MKITSQRKLWITFHERPFIQNKKKKGSFVHDCIQRECFKKIDCFLIQNSDTISGWYCRERKSTTSYYTYKYLESATIISNIITLFKLSSFPFLMLEPFPAVGTFLPLRKKSKSKTKKIAFKVCTYISLCVVLYNVFILYLKERNKCTSINSNIYK